jgi:hypothetical protein
MAYAQAPVVRLERQPHRDAVIRVREAYRRLRRLRGLPAAEPATVGRPVHVQEVQA